MSELNDSRVLCGKVWGPIVHGCQHWCSKLNNHEGDCQCPCGNSKKDQRYQMHKVLLIGESSFSTKLKTILDKAPNVHGLNPGEYICTEKPAATPQSVPTVSEWKIRLNRETAAKFLRSLPLTLISRARMKELEDELSGIFASEHETAYKAGYEAGKNHGNIYGGSSREVPNPAPPEKR